MPGITGDSAEAIALELLMTVARAEGVQLDKDKGGWSKDKDPCHVPGMPRRGQKRAAGSAPTSASRLAKQVRGGSLQPAASGRHRRQPHCLHLPRGIGGLTLSADRGIRVGCRGVAYPPGCP